ncbi:hypothetical protein PYCCODRAFT_1432138 [Trametes coccinea BRFM310]|uniref:Iron-sulfur assembly protein 1 n=1 Tax=Trametes coccinea (strain BRFM310) TaxID=1353009 RepID=A0A1Y2IWZ0_TRAC3|nr:hypothetical protein PYCCODRAFT_1432138 [Trametes coccinea BRFM310]
MSALARMHRATAHTAFFASPSRALLYLPSHRHAMMSAFSHDRPAPPPSTSSSSSSSSTTPSTSSSSLLGETPPVVVPTPSNKPPTARSLSPDAASPQVAARPPPLPKAERPRPQIRATKAAISLTPRAVERLRNLLKGPTPQMIRIGVKNKGCAGLSYHLEYVEKPGKFDEVVEQDGVKVLIDSKALFSIIGSEMDWQEDALSAKFTFNNPNIKDACGCGESFSVGS